MNSSLIVVSIFFALVDCKHTQDKAPVIPIGDFFRVFIHYN